VSPGVSAAVSDGAIADKKAFLKFINQILARPGGVYLAQIFTTSRHYAAACSFFFIFCFISRITMALMIYFGLC